MIVKHKKLAFTLVELLTVLAIITILVALLIPALAMVRKMVRETQQKAQLTTIEMGLTAFKNDYGDYPPSDQEDEAGEEYCGAQKLAEALVGWDLLGFHPKSAWRADGKDKDGGNDAYLGATKGTAAEREKNLKERRGPYLELATANVFRLGDLFDDTDVLDEDRFVICDVFTVKRITLAAGNIIKAGTPILYYRANTAMKTMENDVWPEQIYNFYDNSDLVDLGQIKLVEQGESDTDHQLSDPGVFYSADGGLVDPKVTTIQWPYRPDSYILISAGVDGEYGTSDDICNF